MTDRERRIHAKSNEIVKLLIESGLSISDQLEVIKGVKKRLEFCRSKGAEMIQLKLL